MQGILSGLICISRCFSRVVDFSAGYMAYTSSEVGLECGRTVFCLSAWASRNKKVLFESNDPYSYTHVQS